MRSVLIIGGAVAIGVALIGIWAISSRPPASERAPITSVEDLSRPSDYVELDGLNIATAENFVGHRIRVIGGMVRNNSPQTLRSIELHLAFQDYDEETVHEFDGEALRNPLPPGESRTYEFRFENLPDEWNFRIPVVDVRRVGY